MADETVRDQTLEEGPPESVASHPSYRQGDERAGGAWKWFEPTEAGMHLYEIEVEPAMSFEIISDYGPVQRFDIVAASSADAANEAVRRWRERIRPNVSVTVRQPILIERLSNNVVQTQDAPRGDSWWRRIFR